MRRKKEALLNLIGTLSCSPDLKSKNGDYCRPLFNDNHAPT